MDTVFTLGALNVTVFGLGAALAMLVGLTVSGLYLRRLGAGYGAAIRLAVTALPLAWLGARLLYLLANCTYYFTTLSNPGLMLRFWDGGYSAAGAVLGALAAAALAAKWTHVRTGSMLDAAALGMLPALMLERLFEHGTGLGITRSIITLPLPVYTLEAITAAVLFVLALVWGVRRRDVPAGETAILILTLFSAAQVVLESFRGDGHMEVHFIRIQQVTFLLMLVVLFAVCQGRMAMKKSQRTWCWLIVAACVGLGILMEFRVDRGEHKLLYYAVMAAALAVITALTLIFRRKSEPQA